MCVSHFATTYYLLCLFLTQMENGVTETKFVERASQIFPGMVVLHKLWMLKRCDTLRPAQT